MSIGVSLYEVAFREDHMRKTHFGSGLIIAAGTVLLLSAAAQIARAEDGKALYDKNCVSCHGPAGKGDGPAAKAMKSPPQDFAVGAKAMSEADIATALKEAKVAGKAHPFPGKKLNDEQVTAVAGYVKQLAGK